MERMSKEIATAPAGAAAPARRRGNAGRPRIALAATGLALAGLMASPAAMAAGPAATVRQAAGNDALYGVSCTGSMQCVAVGSRAVGTGANIRPLAESWDGTRWRVLPMPGPASLPRTQVSGISCLTQEECVAVGYHYSPGGDDTADLAEQWNGNRWSIIQSQNPAGARSAFLNDVSCHGLAGCMAVGTLGGSSGGGRAMAELWHGGRWQELGIPQPASARVSELNGISCDGAFCMAVGLYQNADGQVLTLAEYWTGDSWHLLQPVNEHMPISALDGVSCHSPTQCMAVGYSYRTRQQPLGELWTNGRWQLVPAVQVAGGALNAISCPGRARCVAVGSANGQPLTEAWSGASWRLQQAGALSGQLAGELNHLSCSDRTFRCVAVGAWYRPGRTTGQITLATLRNGSSWQTLTTQNP
jgi:uncharacterized membrane protein